MEVAGGRIVGFGDGRAPGEATDLGDVAVLPGLVNAHTHLELSWMAGLIAPSGAMNDWLRALVQVRRAGPRGGAAVERQAANEAARSLSDAGTVLVGDVSNALTTYECLSDAGLGGVIFHEILGFAASNASHAVRQAWDRVRVAEAALAERRGTRDTGNPPSPALEFAVVAHAPYSVSAELFSEIARSARGTPLAVHLAESAEEVEFLRTGRGPIRLALEEFGAWTDDWRVPECDPVQYLAEMGYLQPGVLIVHGVHLTDDGLERLRRARAVLVTCPRSNVWVGAGPPRLAHFYASGVPVAVGTDSLASAPSLNLFDELAEMRRIAPEVAAAALLDSATRVGARALGRGDEFGTIALGKQAAFVTVDVPPGTTDVEEYLVSGVPPASVRPLRL